MVVKGSEKTILVRRILKNYKNCIDISTSGKLVVVWCYGQYQELYREPIDNVEIQYYDHLISKTEILKIKPDLVVIDDLMYELGNNNELSTLFTRGCHHHNISIIYIVQNLFYQGNQMRNISLNCHYLIIMKSFRNKSQIKQLEYQLFGEKTKAFQKIFDEATRLPFSYLIIDMKSDTPDEYRFKSRITEEELPPSLRGKTRFAPYYYIKRD